MEAFRRGWRYARHSASSQWRRCFGPHELPAPYATTSKVAQKSVRRSPSPLQRVVKPTILASSRAIGTKASTLRRERALVRTWDIRNCVRSLQKLVYCLDQFEAAEELRDVIKSRVQDLLPGEEVVEVKTGVFSGQQNRLSEGVERAFSSLQALVNAFIRQSEEDPWLELPASFVDQLAAFSSAENEHEAARHAEIQSILERVQPVQPGAEHSDETRSSTPMSPLLIKEQDSQTPPTAGHDAIENSKKNLVEVTRQLCRDHALKALRDPGLLRQERQSTGTRLVHTAALVGDSGVQGPPAIPQPPKPAKVPRPKDPAILNEWNKARKDLKRKQLLHFEIFNPESEAMSFVKEVPNGTVAEIEAWHEKLFKWRRKAARLLSAYEKKYLQAQAKAMKEGFEPQVDTSEKAIGEANLADARKLAESLGIPEPSGPIAMYLKAFEDVAIPGMSLESLDVNASDAEVSHLQALKEAIGKCWLQAENYELDLITFSEHASDATDRSHGPLSFLNAPELLAIWNRHIAEGFLEKIEDYDPYESTNAPTLLDCSLWDSATIGIGDSRSCQLVPGPSLVRRDLIRRHREECARVRVQADQEYRLRK